MRFCIGPCAKAMDAIAVSIITATSPLFLTAFMLFNPLARNINSLYTVAMCVPVRAGTVEEKAGNKAQECRLYGQPVRKNDGRDVAWRGPQWFRRARSMKRARAELEDGEIKLLARWLVELCVIDRDVVLYLLNFYREANTRSDLFNGKRQLDSVHFFIIFQVHFYGHLALRAFHLSVLAKDQP